VKELEDSGMDGRTNVHDEEQSSWPSLVSDVVRSVNQRLCERWRFTISELSREFPETGITELVKGFENHSKSQRDFVKLRSRWKN
jgi:hypothetical protein